LAVTDGYATAAEYRARVTKTDAGDDTDIDEQLVAVARYIDQKLGRFFTKDAAADQVRIIHGYGGSILTVPDLSAAPETGKVKVDTTGDGVYDTTLVINDDYFVGPVNAALGPEPKPYTFLEIDPNSALISSWPTRRRSVEITAAWGWPAVPNALREASVAICRQVRDLQESGVLASIQVIDAVVVQSRDLARLVKDLKVQYTRPGWL
jgi:hypothetical protein